MIGEVRRERERGGGDWPALPLIKAIVYSVSKVRKLANMQGQREIALILVGGHMCSLE